ncbi:CpaD family pilus assembly protein [Stappia sp.]|uniref:CpaD family pilus assembly protein n=1 Tax=Stappia sp. TaxID=1870903 RepID=UPI003A995097
MPPRPAIRRPAPKGQMRQVVRAAPLALALASALLAAGCQTQRPTTDVLALNDYRLRHPIVVAEGTKTLDLPIGSGTRKLSPQLAAVVSSFAGEARSRGGDAVEVVVPSGSGNEAAVHAVLPQIRSAIARGGISSKRIVTRSYPVSDPNVSAPVRLAYSGIQASAGPCGQWPDNIAGGGNGRYHQPELNNTQYYNFGCSSQANLAAMVENPTDLLYPRASTPADQNRRGTVYEKYRKGEKTSSEYKEGVGAKVSDAVGN